jgi:hypothetical protein
MAKIQTAHSVSQDLPGRFVFELSSFQCLEHFRHAITALQNKAFPACFEDAPLVFSMQVQALYTAPWPRLSRLQRMLLLFEAYDLEQLVLSFSDPEMSLGAEKFEYGDGSKSQYEESFDVTSSHTMVHTEIVSELYERLCERSKWLPEVGTACEALGFSLRDDWEDGHPLHQARSLRLATHYQKTFIDECTYIAQLYWRLVELYGRLDNTTASRIIGE